MDDQSLATILDILRADAQEFSQTNPGAQNELDLVVRAWQEEVDRYASQAADYTTAISLARAIYQDRQILRTIDEEERRTAEDRRIAISLAEGEGPQQCQPPGMTSSLSNQALVVSCAYFYVPGQYAPDKHPPSLAMPIPLSSPRARWNALPVRKRRLRQT